MGAVFIRLPIRPGRSVTLGGPLTLSLGMQKQRPSLRDCGAKAENVLPLHGQTDCQCSADKEVVYLYAFRSNRAGEFRHDLGALWLTPLDSS